MRRKAKHRAGHASGAVLSGSRHRVRLRLLLAAKVLDGRLDRILRKHCPANRKESHTIKHLSGLPAGVGEVKKKSKERTGAVQLDRGQLERTGQVRVLDAKRFVHLQSGRGPQTMGEHPTGTGA